MEILGGSSTAAKTDTAGALGTKGRGAPANTMGGGRCPARPPTRPAPRPARLALAPPLIDNLPVRNLIARHANKDPTTGRVSHRDT